MKGQSAFEFMIYVGIVALIMAVFLWNSLSLQNESMYIKIDTEAKKLCNTIAFEINSAVRTGDGYNRKFLVPKSTVLFGQVTDTTGNF